jgi:hypothetical protein
MTRCLSPYAERRGWVRSHRTEPCGLPGEIGRATSFRRPGILHARGATCGAWHVHDIMPAAVSSLAEEHRLRRPVAAWELAASCSPDTSPAPRPPVCCVAHPPSVTPSPTPTGRPRRGRQDGAGPQRVPRLQAAGAQGADAQHGALPLRAARGALPAAPHAEALPVARKHRSCSVWPSPACNDGLERQPVPVRTRPCCACLTGSWCPALPAPCCRARRAGSTPPPAWSPAPPSPPRRERQAAARGRGADRRPRRTLRPLPTRPLAHPPRPPPPRPPRPAARQARHPALYAHLGARRARLPGPGGQGGLRRRATTCAVPPAAQ